MALRTMPNNLEAEESVLGACFLSKYALEKASEVLSVDSFYSEKNGKIFSAMLSLQDQKIPIDSTTVTTELQNRGVLSEVGGVEYLTEIVNFVPTASNVDHYIKAVEDASILRRLIETATEIATDGYNAEDNVNETLDDAEQKILNIVKNRRSSEFKTIKEVLAKTESDLEILSKNKGDITGLATGWYDLDRLTSGLHENELIIIGARPSMGKTAFALNMATNIAQNTSKAVALFNMEMSAEQLAQRMIASLGQIDGNKLRTGNLINNDWKRINEAMSKLSDTNLYMDDTLGLTIGEIRAKCRRLASSEQGLAIVIIDYIGLISGGKNYGTNRQQEVSDISRGLKKLAMELHVPVVALAQLNRNVEENKTDKRPKLSNLRESGSIEQDADIVAFLHREDYYDKDKREEDISESELIVAKHRNGPLATINLIFKKNTSTFLNMKKVDKGVEPSE